MPARLLQLSIFILCLALPGWALAGALMVALVLGIAFGVMPASRAARLDPVRALARR